MKKVLSLTPMPSGDRHADAYGAWLDVLKECAEAEEIVVENPPATWIPLLLYLGAEVVGRNLHFAEDLLVESPVRSFNQAKGINRTREYVQSVCALRPELVDALWKSDAQWDTVGRRHENAREFNVTTYSCYSRPELQEFERALDGYSRPTGVTSCVLTSCAADKPYPAPHHQAIDTILPGNEWHMVIASGVVGVCPEELWDVMPLYDAGIPNLWRCMSTVEWYFWKHRYERIVIHAEFYNRAIARALAPLTNLCSVEWVMPVGPTADYVDLADPRRIEALKQTIEKPLIAPAWSQPLFRRS